MTMSITGIRKVLTAGFSPPGAPQRAKNGFTLIEVMVAVAVLAFGLVLVYQAFFVSLDAFNYGADYLAVSPWINEKIWLARDSIRRKNLLESDSTEGEFILRNKKFNWRIQASVIDGSSNLTAVDLEVSWKEGKREVLVARGSYARYYEE